MVFGFPSRWTGGTRQRPFLREPSFFDLVVRNSPVVAYLLKDLVVSGSGDIFSFKESLAHCLVAILGTARVAAKAICGALL